MKSYETKNGKKIEIYNEGFAVRVKFVPGGTLPDCLAGSWTDTAKAEQAIFEYLNDKEPVYAEAHTEHGTPYKIKNPKKNPSEE